jgi:hypothetical protein
MDAQALKTVSSNGSLFDNDMLKNMAIPCGGTSKATESTAKGQEISLSSDMMKKMSGTTGSLASQMSQPKGVCLSSNNSSQLQLYYPNLSEVSQKNRQSDKSFKSMNMGSISSKIHSNYNKYLDDIDNLEEEEFQKETHFRKPPKTTKFNSRNSSNSGHQIENGSKILVAKLNNSYKKSLRSSDSTGRLNTKHNKSIKSATSEWDKSKNNANTTFGMGGFGNKVSPSVTCSIKIQNSDSHMSRHMSHQELENWQENMVLPSIVS